MSENLNRLSAATRISALRAPKLTTQEIVLGLGSRDGDERLQSLLAAQWSITNRGPDRRLLEHGAMLLDDKDEDCRWQAGILIGLLISQFPDEVWDLTKRWGVNADPDVRAIVATTILEHLLETYPERFERLADEFAERSSEFRDTFKMSSHKRWQ